MTELTRTQLAFQSAHPLHTPADLDPLMARIGDARFVLLGEASHGTSEYYLWRARLSQRLIQEKGFSFIAVEGDWPDCYRVDRYIKGYRDSGSSARDVLDTFDRWPSWMWANWEMVALVEWMRAHNDKRPVGDKVGFFGLDMYSLWESLTEVTRYLEENVPEAVETARRAFQCFQPYSTDPSTYIQAIAFVPETCEDAVTELLTETQRRARQERYDGEAEAAFDAEQNARVAVDAERYYRAVLRGGASSWNIRDQHMAETLERLMSHYGNSCKGILWEHNTHIGDARATDMAEAGMHNVGQLVRQRWGEDDTVLVGFGGHRGSVIAGSAWGAPMEVMRVPEARNGSWEDVLHRALGQDSLLIFNQSSEAQTFFEERRGHRAIGVVYDPDMEAFGNYVPTSLSRRYDAFLYLEETRALHPLDLDAGSTSEPPDTYPWGV